MTPRQTLYLLTIHGGLAAVVVVAVSALAWHGSVDPQTVSVVLGAVLGIAGASGAAIATLGAAVNGKTVMPAAVMAQREDTLQQAVKGMSGAEVPPQRTDLAP